MCASRELFRVSASTFVAYMTLRGLRTLDLRVERHSLNASKIAKFLNDHPKVKKVIHPSLQTYQYRNQFLSNITERAKNDNLSTGMVSFTLKSNLDDTSNFLRRLR